MLASCHALSVEFKGVGSTWGDRGGCGACRTLLLLLLLTAAARCPLLLLPYGTAAGVPCLLLLAGCPTPPRPPLHLREGLGLERGVG